MQEVAYKERGLNILTRQVCCGIPQPCSLPGAQALCLSEKKCLREGFLSVLGAYLTLNPSVATDKLHSSQTI